MRCTSVRQRPNAERQTTEGLPPGFEEFFRGNPGAPGGLPPTSLGSGFFVDGSGVEVTHHHAGPLLQETLGTSQPDATGRSGHKDGFLRQSHVNLQKVEQVEPPFEALACEHG